MTAPTAPSLAALFARDSADSSILIADGFGLRITVSRGHLVVDDGLGRERRERRLTRSQRAVNRIVVLGHTGHITLDAVRWCHDTGIGITVIDPDGRVLLVAGAQGRDDARLRRAQAAAANSSVGLDIAKALLIAKITGQASVTATHLANETIVRTLHDLASRLADADSLLDARAIEATASNVYFSAWNAGATVQFARVDRHRLPGHWSRFAVRRSPIAGNSARSAADPINAMLNYSYTLAEAEARLALAALGLDPGLGIVHTDKKNRDSLALDLLEPLRPIVDNGVLDLAARRRFKASDFHETRAGVCRLLPPLTHDLADAIPSFARAAARLAEQVAHALANTVPGKITLTTPLSRSNTANTQTRGARSNNRTAASTFSTAKPRRTCQQCGTDLYGAARKLCPTCWPVARNEYIRQLGLARARAKPTVEQLSGGLTLEDYQTVVLPALAAVPLREIERATGLVNASCSRVKRGLQIPNPQLWAALADLATTTKADQATVK